MRKAFTLIEILAVVTIIGLIFILVIPKITNSLNNKKQDIDKTTNNLILSAAKQYISNNKEEFDEEKGNIYCLPIKTLVKKNYLEKVKDINSKDITDIKSIKITYDKGFKYEIVNKNNCSYKKVYKAVEYLLKKANPISVTNYTDGNTHEMYTFEHEQTEQTPALTDYRYIGNVPYNYVKFNGDELWRIIGIFETEDGTGNYEKRIKLIRNDSIGTKQWNSTNANEWIGSTMQLYLNNEYNINLDSKGKMDKVKYYVGGVGRSGFERNGNNFYKIERRITTEIERNTFWIGFVGLMYPSDFIYTYSFGIDDICYLTPSGCGAGLALSGWIYNTNYQWTIGPYSSNATEAISIEPSGKVDNGDPVSRSKGMRPVVYLKQNIKIDSGNGTIDNPYEFEL